MTISMNVFRQDAFSGLTLTEMVNRYPYVPSTLGQLGLFEDINIMTTAVEIDRKDGILNLIPTTPRGAPGVQRTTEKRQARYFECTRLAIEDTIYANELQNVRSDSEEMALKDLREEVAIRLTGPTGLTMQMEYTWERHRLGAIQGKLYDADGQTVLYDWFKEFGITPTSEFVYNTVGRAAGTANTPGVSAGGTAQVGYIRSLNNQVIRTMKRAAKGAWIDGRTYCVALCGDQFFDNFVSDTDVTRTYDNWNAAQDLRANRAFTAFPFSDITWINYRGSDDNSTVAVPTNKAYFFPVNAPGVFKRALAPGEGLKDVNTRGKPLYVYRDMDPSEEQAWVKFKLKSFPLHICTRPEMLLTATMDGTAD